MDQLLDRIQTLERHVQSLQRQTTSVARRLRWWRRLACSLAVLTVFGLPLSLGAGPEDGKGLPQRIEALERKLEHVTSVIGPDGFPELVITGANLRIVNGLGRTDCGTDAEPIPNCPNGLGNLIVGYNELRGFGDVRTGSHNAVIGKEHSFSSFGGLVVGLANSISGAFAVVSGGIRNTASGIVSVVAGGDENIAGDFGTMVCGGVVNTASAAGSTVCGGAGNTANNTYAMVSGGASNTASGIAASVSGGVLNTASGDSSSVSGGQENTTSARFSSVSGGLRRTAVGEFDWLAGELFQDQ
jgi:hypothetical protein